ncbi:hypothetical protein [Paenibacillus sp. FSL L8-0494]|uniref:hypothetical protein n=1 Tax=Paenibacillus sp. FSL L8-0494 TaxID=2975352 RepID=UPI00097B368D|nr:hypothetical protein BJP48_28425 [Paenibacillus odorifer]
MKKKLSLIFLTMFIIILALPLSSALAIPGTGAILDNHGYSLNVGSDENTVDHYTTLASDGDLTSGVTLGASGTTTDTLWMELNAITQINSVKIYHNATVASDLNSKYFKDNLYIRSNNIGHIGNGSYDLQIDENMNKIAIVNNSKNPITIYEVDFFTNATSAPIVVQPTPTPTSSPSPTATPVPTSTPSPTATPTPTVTPKPTATPEQPSGDRAILTITLVNGTEKEYDLPIAEVDAFLKWYDSRDAGRGPGLYAIDKHSNNKGPFSKRKDYVVFDKILTFEVSEYTIE